MEWTPDIQPLVGAGSLDAAHFGARAGRFSRMAAAGGPIPPGVALSIPLIRAIAARETDAAEIADKILSLIGADTPLSLRASPLEPAWGGPVALMNVGLCRANFAALSARIGTDLAHGAMLALIRDISIHVAGIDAARFNDITATEGPITAEICNAAREIYAADTDTAFPDDPRAQLSASLFSMAQEWSRPSAKILRQASGAPADAGLGLILHHHIHPARPGDGKGAVQGIDMQTGSSKFTGYFNGFAAKDTLVSSLSPQISETLARHIRAATGVLSDAARVSFVVENGQVSILDVTPAKRSSFSELQVVADLVDAEILNKEQAILRINPHNLVEHLHPRIADTTMADVLGRGVAASPGAAHGQIVLSAQAAQTAAAQGTRAILLRVETSPEDIRGMNSAAGVVTLTGGLSSHAAVIAQGLGVPCVVGARNMRIDQDARQVITDDGRVLSEGDIVTINGSDGTLLAGAMNLTHAELTPAFREVMAWADDIRTIGVRANADTPQDARVAKRFLVDGIGLCRTEHMLYASERLDVMREMILTGDVSRRHKALARLLPFQRDDFAELFEIMAGAPVTIRLLDPPLHEFLPKGQEEVQALAEAMDLPLKTVRQRIEDMQEFNPMLGMRGVRLAITMPEIYEMQARAIFEAALAAGQKTGAEVVPEIMIPLVSAQREVDLVKERIEAVAQAVANDAGRRPNYKLGVMVETPRAALRSGDLARSSAFLSFGTNDLTQMTYGLSRDDAGRFMREYVQVGVFNEDPFLTLDVEGIGELLLIAARRGRASNPDIELGLCGEHGGDPVSVQFCKLAGFSYVSCSPFRVPIARLAAAQASILETGRDQSVLLPDQSQH